ncbi:HIT domain-containing protein [Actinosynnema sp. NPDC047251]|uniref:AP-4-A phosphorylase n=1 Tax=Saccharothrix espanaensis (strain ATCC 51144 / DSM 44229 / JCM 9112 / NBRC 15066 / NRRL 15764) TaxID=1179773 RepID=K0JWA9_SACES|nr:HIT domain-containing protein [Saccharothrix espanaensis]CCH30336.1 AP-4-A phosphorylase [Saccharothrix espanaensis DSM 44229]
MTTEYEEQDGVGVHDALQRLWTPHRLSYVRGEGKADGDEPAGCPFCRVIGLDDPDGLLLARGERVFAVLNLYPYNPGHLMVLPYRHVPDYTDLDPAEVAEFAEFTQRAMRVIRAVAQPHGFNIGMNQGVVAGAGIAAHLHQHVVPRWGGDANFMPVVGHTKVIPQLLRETRQLLSEAWPAH